MLDKIWIWLQGKRTYIVAILTAIFSVLAAFGIVIPEWVYAILAACGLTFIRAAIK